MSPPAIDLDVSKLWPDSKLASKRLGLALAEHAAIPLLFVDADLRVHYANAESRELFGVAGRPIASNLLELLPGLRELDIVTWGAPTGFLLLDELTRMGTQLEARRPGAAFKVEIDSRPILVEGIEGRVLIVRDMSEQNASIATVLRAHHDLEEFNRMAVGRELRMVELKEEVNALLAERDLPPRYEIED